MDELSEDDLRSAARRLGLTLGREEQQTLWPEVRRVLAAAAALRELPLGPGDAPSAEAGPGARPGEGEA